MRKLPLYLAFVIGFYLATSCSNNDSSPRDQNLQFKSTSFELNPYERAPLSAIVYTSSKQAVTINVEILGKNGAPSFSYSLSKKDTLHEIPVAGLYGGYTNSVVVKGIEQNRVLYIDTLMITTDALPEILPTIIIKSKAGDKMEPGWTMAEFSKAASAGFDFRSHPIMYDEYGEIRWYLDLSFTGSWCSPMLILANKNLCFGAGNYIYEYSFLGEEINKWKLDGFAQHHDIYEKPNGNLIILVDVEGQATIEDYVVEMTRSTGSVIRSWDLRQILQTQRFDLVNNPTDWVHTNAVIYDPRDNTLIISGRNQGLFKVDNNNNLKWILSPHKGWDKDGSGRDLKPYLFTAVNSAGTAYGEDVQQGAAKATDFDWTWGQHAPELLPNGDLMVFDNGFNRQFSTAEQYSRLVEYNITENAAGGGQIKQVFQFGQQFGATNYSSIISDVDLLPVTKNRLFAPGTVDRGKANHAVAIEFDNNGNTVFEASIVFKNGFANGQSDIVFREERMLLSTSLKSIE